MRHINHYLFKSMCRQRDSNSPNLRLKMLHANHCAIPPRERRQGVPAAHVVVRRGMAATSLVDAGARRLLAREGQTLHAREHVSSGRGLADCVAQRVHSQRGTACSLACGRGARPGERAAEASRRLCARDGWSTRHSQLGFVAAHGLQQLGQRLFVLCVLRFGGVCGRSTC